MTIRLDEDELLVLADHNLAEFNKVAALWDRAGEVAIRDDIQLVASGTRFPAGGFNCLHARGPAPDAARARSWLAQAFAFYQTRERGFSVYTRAHCDAELAAACAGVGMQAMAGSPGMVLDASVSEAVLPTGVRIERVLDASGLADYAAVAAPAFAMMALPETVTETVFSDAQRVLSPELSLHVAFLAGQPVATALSLLSHGIAGLYWIGTRPDMQRRGLADAITRRASNAAFERGAARVILQASPFGAPVYRRIGYREITSYPWFFMTSKQLASRSLPGSGS
jgi:GNAT superfamily N-acetyltransferase